MQEIRKAHNLTQWQFFILAIEAVNWIGATIPVSLDPLIEKVKKGFPQKNG